MKIAISAEGSTLESPVDPRFGRARSFVLWDTGSHELSVTENAGNLHALRGAGIQAGRELADLGVEAVITGHVGPNAVAALRAAGIAVHTGAVGTVSEAIAQFEAGALPKQESEEPLHGGRGMGQGMGQGRGRWGRHGAAEP